MLVAQLESVLAQSVSPTRILLSVSFRDPNLPVVETIDRIKTSTTVPMHVLYYSGHRLHQFSHLYLLCARFPPINVKREEASERGESLRSCSDWIAFCDDDDICHPRRLETIIAFYAQLDQRHAEQAQAIYCARLVGALDVDDARRPEMLFTDVGRISAGFCETKSGEHGAMHVREQALRDYCLDLKIIRNLEDCFFRGWLVARSLEMDHDDAIHHCDQFLYFQRLWMPESEHWTGENGFQACKNLLRNNFCIQELLEHLVKPYE